MMCEVRSKAVNVAVGFCTLLLAGCLQAVPQELVDAIEAIDRDLIALRAPEVAADDYARFVHQWVPLKARVQSDDDLIRWPWESNDLEADLRRLYEEGGDTVARLNDRRAAQRRAAETKLARLEDRAQLMASQVEAIDGRIVLGGKPVQTDLLIKQARAFLAQGDYERSLQAAEDADQALLTQSAVLSRELGRYADEKRIGRWQTLARQTIEWSRQHQSSAIVVSKAERVLVLYKSGHKVLAYPIRLGFNGIREKQYQGDGATPEGRYRVTRKRGQGQTQFYRALVLDYPNTEDRRRFDFAKKSGRIPPTKSIGGQIEIHGNENEAMAQTLGCIMLDNPHMAAIFDRVEAGTPVTIVGALTNQNSVAVALTQLTHREEET